jgi:hypothetical protein
MGIDHTPYEESGLTFGRWLVATGRCHPDRVEFYFDEITAGRMTPEDLEAFPPSEVNNWAAAEAAENPVLTPQAQSDQDFRNLYSEEGLAKQRAEAELAAGGAQPDGRRMPGLAPRPIQRHGRPTTP